MTIHLRIKKSNDIINFFIGLKIGFNAAFFLLLFGLKKFSAIIKNCIRI